MRVAFAESSRAWIGPGTVILRLLPVARQRRALVRIFEFHVSFLLGGCTGALVHCRLQLGGCTPIFFFLIKSAVVYFLQVFTTRLNGFHTRTQLINLRMQPDKLTVYSQ